jgi:hypothetical protein
MRNSVVSLGVAVLGLAVCAEPAFASPITTYYQVTLNQKIDFHSSAQPTVDVNPFTFVMTMTFDDQPTVPPSGEYGEVIYNAPTFGGIPDLGGTGNGSTTNGFLDHIATAFGYTQVVTQSTTSGVSSSRGSQLAGFVTGPGHTTDTSSLIAFLAATTMEFRTWSFSYDPETGNYDPNSMYMIGTARPMDPVPEPATIALLGSGLAVAAFRARRRRRD